MHAADLHIEPSFTRVSPIPASLCPYSEITCLKCTHGFSGNNHSKGEDISFLELADSQRTAVDNDSWKQNPEQSAHCLLDTIINHRQIVTQCSRWKNGLQNVWKNIWKHKCVHTNQHTPFMLPWVPWVYLLLWVTYLWVNEQFSEVKVGADPPLLIPPFFRGRKCPRLCWFHIVKWKSNSQGAFAMTKSLTRPAEDEVLYHPRRPRKDAISWLAKEGSCSMLLFPYRMCVGSCGCFIPTNMEKTQTVIDNTWFQNVGQHCSDTLLCGSVPSTAISAFSWPQLDFNSFFDKAQLRHISERYSMGVHSSLIPLSCACLCSEAPFAEQEIRCCFSPEQLRCARTFFHTIFIEPTASKPVTFRWDSTPARAVCMQHIHGCVGLATCMETCNISFSDEQIRHTSFLIRA